MKIEDLATNPLLKDINPQKLQILGEVLSQAGNKSTNELLPYFMAASQKASSMGVAFSNSETDLIIDILTQNMSDAEKARVNSIRKLAMLVSNKKK
ncbi:MAG: hypothetical protein E7261_04345 [Lachnospiraceae bacterium]|nr:hypothetical protein [Lachnospiraceae bacterium]